MANDESFISELQQIMYSFGDCSKPLLESVKLVSDVVLNNIIKIVYQLEETCLLRESEMVGIEEILFLYRKNYKKLKQVIEFLRFKDLKAQYTNGGGKGGIEIVEDIMGSTNPSSKRVKLCSDFLNTMDPTGSLATLVDTNDDDARLERYNKFERLTRGMNTIEYNKFTQARRIGFSSSPAGIAKFKNWVLPHCCEVQVELSGQTWDILAYLARDMVGELVECSLAVRKGFKKSSHRKLEKISGRYKQQQQQKQHSSQLSQSECIALGGTTSSPLVSPSFGSSLESKQKCSTANTDTNFSVGADLKHYQAITVSEIREAIRRLCLLNQPLTWNLKCVPIPISKRRLL